MNINGAVTTISIRNSIIIVVATVLLLQLLLLQLLLLQCCCYKVVPTVIVAKVLCQIIRTRTINIKSNDLNKMLYIMNES